MEAESALYLLYDHYCRFGGDGIGGAGMTSRNFAKFMRDRGGIDAKVTLTTVDLAFTKAGHGRKRISYDQFCFAIQCCAKAKELPVAIYLQRLLSTEAADPSSGTLRDGLGVAYNGVTKAEYNRFYDDRSTWNALHKNGGPEAVPKGRGHKPVHIGRDLKREQSQPHTGADAEANSRRRASEVVYRATREVEGPRRSSAAPEYTSARKNETRRDTTPPLATSTLAARRSSATPDLAAAGWRKDELQRPLTPPLTTIPLPSAGGAPSIKYTSVTKPQYNRFYDDRSTWTQMHKQGGPDHGPKRGSLTTHWTGGLRT